GSQHDNAVKLDSIVKALARIIHDDARWRRRWRLAHVSHKTLPPSMRLAGGLSLPQPVHVSLGCTVAR
ncbi:MAG: hypothetical protein OXU20_20285, partial [Myxococcales bacterium]|nr:hypothetical protein [Myxococcales bacterium]